MVLVLRDSEDEVNNDGRQQGEGQDCGTETVIDAALAAFADTGCAPVEGTEGVDHGRHGDDGKETGGDTTDAVTEVQETDGQTAQDDGEVEPGEEGPLVGEEDLGFDSGGQGDALAFGGVCQSGLLGIEMIDL